jgi:hypothetical protein
MKFITAFIGMLAGAMSIHSGAGGNKGTPSRKTSLRNRDNLPSFEAGSKLQRKALAGTLTMKRGRNY